MLSLIEADGRWLVSLVASGAVLAVRDEQDAALAALVAAAAEQPEQGLLPESWSGPIARSTMTGDGRDFTATTWSWRDPNESRLPLMWQTETNMGHFSALLAGFITELSIVDGAVWATGRFFDSDEGRAFRDHLAAAGRWGVSVDPGQVEWEEQCTEMDDDGFCIEGVMQFLAYEVIGVTGTPFPAFADAWIELQGAQSAAEPAESDAEPDAGADVAEAAAHAGEALTAGALAKPPAAWFTDPQFSEPTSLTIDDDGRVRGHVATFDTCHIGWRGTCVTAPDKVASTRFHTGTVLTAEGDSIATGPLVMGTDHPATTLDASAAIDHYAHTGLAWADVVLGVDDIGIWCAGAMRPGISDDQVRVLRGSSLSGDWRTIAGELQLCAVLAVNTPGFPIPRALAASGKPYPHDASMLRARLVNSVAVAATGLGLVKGCANCRAELSSAQGSQVTSDRLDRIERVLSLVELRTRALSATRRDQLAARLRREP